MSDHDIERELKRIEARIDSLTAECDLILKLEHKILDRLIPRPTGGVINQLKSRSSIMSTPAGGTSTFAFAYTPLGSVAPVGTTQTWSVDDTADITLAPSADGFTCVATCVAAPTGTSYNLTCTSSFTPPGAPAPISATVNVAITGVVANTPTGGTITQTA